MRSKKQYREAIKISRGVQCEVADLLGVSRQAVNQYLDAHPDLKDLADSFVDVMLDRLEKHIADRVDRNEIEGLKLAARYYGHRRGLIERKEITGEDGTPLISEGTSVNAQQALILHSDDGRKLLDLLHDLSIPRIESPRSQGDRS